MSKKKVTHKAKKFLLKHDGYFREAFETIRIAKAFLKKALPQEALVELDLDQLAIEKRHFNDELFKEKIADVVYRVPIKGCEENEYIEFFVILEHKSYSDNFVIFQLWCYVFHLCRLIFQRAKDKKQANSEFKFSPVVAIIVHHGESRFHGVTELSQLFFSLPGLKKYLPRLEAILFDLNAIEDDAPKLNDPDTPELKAIFMVLKVVFRQDIAPTLREVLRTLKPYSDDPTTRRLIRLSYIYLANSAKYWEQNCEAMLQTFQEIEGGETMPTMIENWIAESKAEGKVEGKAESVIRILVRKWSRVPQSLKDRIFAIEDIKKLEELFDFALDCGSLKEFTKHVP